MAGEGDGSGAGTSLTMVAGTFVASLFAILTFAGLLRQGGASPTMTRAVLAFVGVTLAIAQPPGAAELARRMGGTLADTRAVSMALRVSSLLLLALAVLMSVLL